MFDDPAIVAVNPETGETLWRVDEGSVRWQTPVVLNQVVYARQGDGGKIYAISLENGKVSGYLLTGTRFLTPAEDDVWRPIVADGKLIVPVEKDIYAYGP